MPLTRKFRPNPSKRSGAGAGRPPPLVHALVLSSHGRCELYGKCHDAWDYERDAVKVVPPGIDLVMMCPVGYTITDNSLVHTLLSTTLKQISTGQLDPGGGRNARRFLSPGDPYIDVTLSPSADSNDLAESGIFHRHLMQDNRNAPLRHIPIPHTMRLSEILEHKIRPWVGANRALVVVDTCRELRVRPNLDHHLHSGLTDKVDSGICVMTREPTRPIFTGVGIDVGESRRMAAVYNNAMADKRELLANLRKRNSYIGAALRRVAAAAHNPLKGGGYVLK